MRTEDMYMVRVRVRVRYTNAQGIERRHPTCPEPARPTIHADTHSRGHDMAQVALSRAQPSSPHRPPSRSSRGRPFTFTSAIARELADRAALASRFIGPQAIALESETYLDTLSMCVRVKIGFFS